MTDQARPLADEVLDRLVQRYDAAREPERAIRAAAYMRDQFAFLGFPVPTQRALGRAVVAGLPAPTEDELRTVVLACWDLREREYQYFAGDWLRTHVAVPGPGFIDTARTLITTKSWWDTVDPLATRFVGRPDTPISSCARRSAGLCGTTPAPTRTRCAGTWRATGPRFPRCRSARPPNTSRRSAGGGAATGNRPALSGHAPNRAR